MKLSQSSGQVNIRRKDALERLKSQLKLGTKTEKGTIITLATTEMDKKTFKVEDNISQSGGSVLQTMQNLPGVTVQDGKVQLRGNDKVTVLIGWN